MSALATRHPAAPLRPLLLLAAVLVALLGLAPGARAEALDPPVLGAPALGASVTTSPEFGWTAVPRAARYRIQVSTSSAFSDTAWTADVYGTTATPITELPLGTLYWRVASLDSTSAPGAWSATRSFSKVQAAAPVLTSPASATTLGYPFAAPVLAWQAVAGMKQYRVQVDDETTFTGASTYTTTSTSFALPAALPSNTPRYWRVQGVATNTDVTTAWSDTGDLRTFSIAWASGTVPTLLTPADSLTDDTDDVEFSWTPVPGAAQYEIQVATNEDFTAGVITQLTDATHYRMVNTLTQDQYYWRVRARQANAEPAGWSAVWRFKREWLDHGLQARPTVTIPDADPLVDGIQQESNRILISWSAVRRASYYELEVSTEPGFNGTITTSSMVHRSCKTPHTEWTPYLAGSYTGTTGFPGCAWTGTPMSEAVTRFIVPGTMYYVRVRAVDQTPGGATITTLWSNAAREGGTTPAPVTFTPIAPTTATTAAGAPAVPLSSPDSADTPTLTWAPVQGAVAYRVALARDSGFNSRVLDSSIITTNTALRINQVLLDNSTGQPYFWFATPCQSWIDETHFSCDVGESQAINVPGAFATFNKLGKAVEGLTAAPQQTDTVALSWQDQLTTSPGGGGVKYYEVDVRDAADQPTTSVPVKTDALGYTPIASTIADGQYTWRVRAIDASGTALAWSAPGSFEKRSSVPQPLAPDAFQTLPTLRWNATSFAASYDVEVFRGVDPDFPAGSKVAAASATTLPYPVMTPSAALAAGSYSWRVRQHDATGKVGPWSTDVLPFTVGGDQPVTSAPADTAGVPVPSLVYRWSAVPGAVRYRVESSTSSGFGTLTESVVTSSTAYAPTAAHVGGTTYYWRVSALNAADATMRTSDPASFTAQTAPAAPTASAAVAGRSIGVSWTTPGTGGAPISGYVLRFRPAGTTDWTEQSLAGDVGAAGLGEVPAGQKYEAQVAAVNAVGTGPFSALVTSTAPTVPGTPSALKLAARAGGLSVTWSKPGDGGSAITGYAVRVQPVTGGSVTETSAAASPAVIDGLAQGVAYTVEVAAENIVGRGAFVAGQGTTGTVPSTASAITLTGPAAVGYGRAAALAGALTSKAGAPIAGAAVVLQSRKSSTAPWVAVTPVTTGANGAFTAAVTPTANTQYQAIFAGAPPNLGVTSTALSVMVAPKIALRAKTLSARMGRTVRLAGSVLPKTAGRTVTLSCLEQRHWVARATGRTSSTGAFRVPLKLTARGRKTCRIDTTADAVAGAGQSARVLIRAR